jgi:hypothetical protein
MLVYSNVKIFNRIFSLFFRKEIVNLLVPGEANVEDKVHSLAHGEASGVARGHNLVHGVANEVVRDHNSALGEANDQIGLIW